MQLGDIMNVLQKYTNASPANPSANVEQDFEHVAQNAPTSHLASGLTHAFNSDQTPPFGQMISQLFQNSNDQQRAGILNQLLGAAGSGGLSSGMLGSLSGILGGSQGQVTPQQAAQVSPEAVQQLATHAQSQDPSIVQQAGNFYAQHPTLVKALGAGSLALIMSHMSRS